MSEPAGTVPEIPTTPIPGDGVVDILIPGEVKQMPAPFDLPEGFGGLAMAELTAGFQTNTLAQRNTFATAVGAQQASIVKQSAEMGTEESRAISGVMGTPIGGPTNKQV